MPVHVHGVFGTELPTHSRGLHLSSGPPLRRLAGVGDASSIEHHFVPGIPHGVRDDPVRGYRTPGTGHRGVGQVEDPRRVVHLDELRCGGNPRVKDHGVAGDGVVEIRPDRPPNILGGEQDHPEPEIREIAGVVPCNRIEHRRPWGVRRHLGHVRRVDHLGVDEVVEPRCDDLGDVQHGVREDGPDVVVQVHEELVGGGTHRPVAVEHLSGERVDLRHPSKVEDVGGSRDDLLDLEPPEAPGHVIGRHRAPLHRVDSDDLPRGKGPAECHFNGPRVGVRSGGNDHRPFEVPLQGLRNRQQVGRPVVGHLARGNGSCGIEETIHRPVGTEPRAVIRRHVLAVRRTLWGNEHEHLVALGTPNVEREGYQPGHFGTDEGDGLDLVVRPYSGEVVRQRLAGFQHQVLPRPGQHPEELEPGRTGVNRCEGVRRAGEEVRSLVPHDLDEDVQPPVGRRREPVGLGHRGNSGRCDVRENGGEELAQHPGFESEGVGGRVHRPLPVCERRLPRRPHHLPRDGVPQECSALATETVRPPVVRDEVHIVVARPTGTGLEVRP